MSLRIGTACAVIDDDGRILLSKRGDLGVWGLPGGRLDAGERLQDGAAREVREETGVIVHVDRAVGLYYLAGWNRMNVLYTGIPVGGDIVQRTRETRENSFFRPDELPDMPLSVLALDALAETRHKPRVIDSGRAERRRIKRRLAIRWMQNWLSGHPEPKFPEFKVQAAGVIWDEAHRRVLTVPGERARCLPRVACDGENAPWEVLASWGKGFLPPTAAYRWVGLYESPAEMHITFIFAATFPAVDVPHPLEWTTARSIALDGLDSDYVELVKPGYGTDPVWTLPIKDDIAVEEGLL